MNKNKQINYILLEKKAYTIIEKVRYHLNNNKNKIFIGKYFLIQSVPELINIHKLYDQSLEHTLNLINSIHDLVHNQEINVIHNLNLKKLNIKSKRDIVLFGFGRIGRILTRVLCEENEFGLFAELKAIVIRKKTEYDIEKRASLLQLDSVHGKFKCLLEVKEDHWLINGNKVHIIFANHPSEIDYESYGISNAILVDNTGIWRETETLSQHLVSGISKVILTAPAKGDIPNIIYGINTITNTNNILSAASCTTNAICPVLKVINDAFKIVSGHIETVHSYTNDQNLIDNYHTKYRRGRGAATNIVLTETGAGTAVSKCLPELTSKLTANAVRVPVPNVSMAILILNLSKSITKKQLFDVLDLECKYGKLAKQIEVSECSDGVSSDFIGNKSTAIIDKAATIIQENRCNLYVWYDNEYGYSCQVARLIDSLCIN